MQISVSLTSFIDFNRAVGPRRMKVAHDLREMYESPNHHPWDYYGDMLDAVVEGFRHDDLPIRLEAACAKAASREASGDKRCRGQSKHYQALAAGALTLQARTGNVHATKAPVGQWTHGQLRLRVAPHLAVTRRDGREEAWYFYRKDKGLTQGSTDGALLAMHDVLRRTGSLLTPCVIDLRTGDGFSLAKNRSLPELRTYLTGEAEHFLRLWDCRRLHEGEGYYR